MPPASPSPNGHHDVPGAFKTPAPHPVPSVAAKMAEADAERDAAARAELAQRTSALRDQISLMLATDPASLIMALPDLFGGSLVEMVATGVQLGIQRATEAERQRTEHMPAEAPAETPSRKPFLIAQTGNVNAAAQAAMTGMPPPGPQG